VHPQVSKARARVAGLSRAVNNGERPDDGELRSAKTDLAAAKIAAYVEKVLAQAAPPLSDEQRIRLAELLRPARQPDRQAVIDARLAHLDGDA
jgi:hypothetical protein